MLLSNIFLPQNFTHSNDILTTDKYGNLYVSRDLDNNIQKDIENNQYSFGTMAFLNSSVYGKEYENDMFVGTIEDEGSRLLHFDLSNNIESPGNNDLDNIIQNESNFISTEIGVSFNLITDLEVNPYDGYLYLIETSIPKFR